MTPTRFTRNALAGVCALALSGAAWAQEQAPVHAAEVAGANAATLEQRVARGEALYGTHCVACHQANGTGLAGAFPPLANSDYFADDPGKMATCRHTQLKPHRNRRTTAATNVMTRNMHEINNGKHIIN